MIDDLELRLDWIARQLTHDGRAHARGVLARTRETKPAGALADTLAEVLADLRMVKHELGRVRQQAEAEHERFRDLFDAAPDGYLLTDVRGVVNEANAAATDMLNRPGRFLLNKPMVVLVEAEDRRRFYQAIERMHYEPSCSLPLRLLPRGRATIHCDVSINAIRDDRGKLTGVRWLIRDVTEQHQLRQQLEEAQRDLRRMNAELALAEERERRRLAVMLHDDLGQKLALLSMQLSALRRTGVAAGPPPDGAPDPVKDMQAMVADLIRQTRTLTFELSPPILYEMGLVAALQWLADRRSTDALRFEVRDDGRPKHLSTDVSVLLFQATRELMFNVVKHSKATSASVNVRRTGGTAAIDVEDDGVGFDPGQWKPTDRGGFGLFSIRERLRHVGGTLTITSSAAAGTVATIEVPTAPPAEAAPAATAGEVREVSDVRPSQSAPRRRSPDDAAGTALAH